MAYDKNKLTKLGALEALAQRVKSDYATKASVDALEDRVDALVTAGGEPNVITSIKVNGAAQTVTDKAVNIAVPTKVSQIANDSGFQTSAQVTAAIGGLRTELMGEGVPEAYDTFKELADYIDAHQTAADALTAAVGNKVDKVTGKGLSTNDYTTAEKTKLAGLSNYTHPSYAAKTAGLYKITVDALGHVSAATAVTKADITALGIPSGSAATSTAAGLMSAADKAKLDGMTIATDAEVTEMLNTVFGVAS